MTKRETERCIDYKLAAIKRLTGLDLRLDKSSYGYCVYIATADHCRTTGGTCFVEINTRRSAGEMLAYLDGVYNVLLDVKNGHITINK